MDEIKKKVRKFIEESFLDDEEDALADDESLLDLGMIDSAGILMLVVYLEETFEIHVDDDEVVPENLESIDAIVRFVAEKLGTTT